MARRKGDKPMECSRETESEKHLEALPEKVAEPCIG